VIHVLIPTTSERRPRLAECVKALRKSTVPFQLHVFENEGMGWVAASRAMLADLKPGTPAFLMGDDMLVAPDTLAHLYQAWVEKLKGGNGICQPWEKYHGGELAVCPFGAAGYVLALMHPGYFHLYGDAEMTVVAKARGEYVAVPEAKLDHRHVIGGDAPMDGTYRIANSRGAEDKALFEKRIAFMKANNRLPHDGEES